MFARPAGRLALILAAVCASVLLVPRAIAEEPADDLSPPETGSNDSGTDESGELSSTEQGQAPIEDLFTPPSRAARERELRRQAFRDTVFTSELRTFYMDSNNLNGTQNEAWALGGSAGFKTGYFRDLVAFGVTGYTSQRLEGPPDKDGTTLLATGQHGYSALGEAYAEFALSRDISATVGLRGYDTPFLSRNDSRMTPNTFEGVAIQGNSGGDDGAPSVRFGAGYIDKIKERNEDTFVSMAEAAGAKAGVSRGVSVAGGNYVSGDFTIGALGYYSSDIMDIFYVATKDSFALTPRLKLGLAAQYTSQHSVGDNLLLGHTFSAGQFGLRAELSFANTLLTTAYTQANGDGTTVQSPWSANPGYTTVQVENFDRSGERALMFRAAYQFPRFKSLSAYVLYVDGTRPNVANQYAQDEFDMNVQWKVTTGSLRGLKLLMRYGHVSQQGPTENHTNQLRLVAYYDLPPYKPGGSDQTSCDSCSEPSTDFLAAAN